MGQVRLLLVALQFLTRLPVPQVRGFTPDMISRSTRYYPVVGALVGGICALVLTGAAQVWDGVLPAMLAIAVGVLVTGAFHEDGLADTFDGLGGGTEPARRLEIMKDSRIGTFGALGLGLVLALKVAALAQLAPPLAALGLLCAHAGGRTAAVLAMAALAPVGQSAKWSPDRLRPIEPVLAVVLGAAPLVLLGAQAAPALALGLALAALPALASRRLIGGYTGDILGAVEQMFELGVLLALAAL
ncbi:MAG TPA: adenosylcobinamide-GDP ribazoletransferase [Phenylobacterium sp.]|nr:adenosylcobinamide-GDP ribazoletransferase [Phenylobacterium sp.]HQP19829.1 adenosylcobinamide-GDP ribazoletransferase [Phenylobacterium sp.]